MSVLDKTIRLIIAVIRIYLRLLVVDGRANSAFNGILRLLPAL